MDKYIIIHQHDYGVNTALIQSDHEPGDDEVARFLGWNYEPDKDESLDIYLIEDSDIKTLPPTAR